MTEPKMTYRRLMAFIGIGAILYYTLFKDGEAPWVLGSYLFLVAMWVFNPDTFIKLMSVIKGNDK